MNQNSKYHPLTVNAMRARLIGAVLALCAFGYVTDAVAFELGHSRVSSAPGSPLVMQVPLRNVTPAQADALSVNVADASAWQAAGLTPPVPLSSFTLVIKPGLEPNSQVVEVRSSQSTQATVIDILLSVRTDAASRMVQTSVIVPPAPQVRVASDQVIVARGDTLSGIARQFPVQGANLYQQLWALFSANPDAFMRENMNLLKTGAALRIPDADTVRAVDPAFAKAQYLAQVRAFKQGREVGQGNQGIAAEQTSQALQASPDQQQGSVEPASNEPSAPVNDEVKLTAAQQDAQAAEDKARAEELARKQALEQNISTLQGAIAAAGTSAAQGDSADAQNAPSDAAVVSQDGLTAAADAGNTDAVAAASGAAGSDASGAQAGNNEPLQSQDAFARMSQWVSDNTTAAIALLLALIALILAWALRATKKRKLDDDAVSQRVDEADKQFEQKLKDIDLSLDDQSDPAKPASSNNPQG